MDSGMQMIDHFGRANDFYLTIPFKPHPKGRPRFVGGYAITDPKTRIFEREVALFARALLGPEFPKKGAVFLMVGFYFERPKSSKRVHHTVKPDLDNLVKGIKDALNGIVWFDDAQVNQILAEKHYLEHGKPDHIRISGHFTEELALPSTSRARSRKRKDP